MRRSFIPVLFLIPCLLQVLGAAGVGWMDDDAFIGFRFVNNFLGGHGLTWNIGEKPVEGYTNFLYLMLLCPHRLFHATLPGWSILLNLLLSLMSLGVAALLTRRLLGRSSFLCLLPPLLMSLNLALNFWVMGGLETHLFTLLLLVAALLAIQALEHDRPLGLGLLSLALALAALTRPEALALSFVLFAVISIRIFRRHGVRRRAAWLRLAALLIPMAALVGGHTLWRLSYYGYLFPNTFYAKTGDASAQLRRGWQYVATYLDSPQYDGLILLFILPATWRFWWRRGWVVAGFIGVLFGLAIGLGGDWMAHFRFLAPAFPFAYVLLALSLDGAAATLKATPRLALFARGLIGAACVMIILRLGLGYPERYRPQFARSVAVMIGRGWWPLGWADPDGMCETARYLKKNLPPETLVAAHAIGRLGYYSGLPVLDRLGLCDTQIAHRKMEFRTTFSPGHDKHDEAYVLRRRPDLIVPGCGPIQPARLAFSTPRQIETAWQGLAFMPGDYDLFQMEEFWRAYRPEIIEVGGGKFLHVFRRVVH